MKLRLLHVEDCADDQALLLSHLKRDGFDVEHFRVETEAQLRAALREPDWDVVISDFNLPEMTAMDALDVVKSSGLDLPFVVVSGAVGEERAVEAMRRGAHDYVMKSNLCRLPESIRREVKEAGLRRERRSLEEQVRQAQKMEVLGQLASGVAHDFNNLLTVMISFSQFAHDELPSGHSSREDLREVVDCGHRAALLTRQLLAFGRKSVGERQIVDLNEAISSSEKMLTRLLGPRIDYATLPAATPCHVLADRSNIEQILVNVIVNARDAMPAGGKITVETTVVDGPNEPRVRLAISDTGCGMSEDLQQRIFEPFFTTKGPGRGTGLGLSTVQGIVKECGGEISLVSALGKGTTFRVDLPQVLFKRSEARVSPERKIFSGSETVLVVEDEETVRAAVSRALSSNGYDVLEASHPQAALTLLEQRPRPVHLVLSDMLLPDMTGTDLVAKVRTLRHDVAVLYMSGNAGDALPRQTVADVDIAFLQKPFTPDALVRKVRATLDAWTNKPALSSSLGLSRV